MSTRDKLVSMLDMLSEEQLEGLYSFINSFIYFGDIPNEETQQAIRDAHNGVGLSEAYDSVSQLREALNAED